MDQNHNQRMQNQERSTKNEELEFKNQDLKNHEYSFEKVANLQAHDAARDRRDDRTASS